VSDTDFVESSEAGARAHEPALFSGASVRRTSQKPRRVIAVSGAKGGAGKSVIASNLAIYLASLGRSTVIVDADLSGAHLHTLLGLPPLLPSQASSVADLGPLEVVPTSVPGMFFINGGLAQGHPGQIRPRERKELFEALEQLDCDYMVLDLGAGIDAELLESFRRADVGLYVILPEPAAAEGSYRFVRALFLHTLMNLATDAEQRVELARLAEELGGFPVPRELVETLEADHHELAKTARELFGHFEVHFVVNQTRLRDDLDLGESIRSATWQRLGVSLDYLGYVDHDDTVWTCVRACQPLLIKSPSTKASKNIEKLARRVIALDPSKAGRRVLRTVPPGTHHDLLEVDRGATDEEIRRAHRRMREVYAPDALCCYGLFSADELAQIRARLEEAFDVLLDRARRKPYELSVFPEAPEPEEEIDLEARTRDLPAAPAVTPETQFDGALLRAMRESRGVELVQISRRTKISLAYLEAIEDDDFAALPAVVYVRGFVAEMAKCLQLDPIQASQTYVRRVKRNLGESNA
jgi:flagellar biosynthesis protein FlhG